jgi:NAD(P)-dependent dehydrogenase (short-subunit alcohol dehydrogenase family)
LNGKVAVLTGAGGGIGLATGRLLARQGMRVVLADINEDRLNAAGDACRNEGLDVLTVPTDVSSFEAMQHLADAAYGAFGAVHVLHLNAGIGSGASLFDDATANWAAAVGVNFYGVVWGIKAFVPRMVERGEDAVVLATSSGSGAEGTTYGTPGYSATKAAVLSVMECLYGQLRDRGSNVRVGVVFPPLTATNLAGNPETMKAVEAQLKATGVDVTLVEPESVAEMVLDGIKRGRFFIRAGAAENAAFFDGRITPGFLDWNARVVRARADAQLSDGTPDAYIW